MKKAIIIGAGLGGLATALRLSVKGYKVSIIEKHHQAGGRLNQLCKDGFSFDIGPSFFSMSYEFDELFASCGVKNPLKYEELDPLYAVHFSHRKKPFLIYKDLEKLSQEFKELEPAFYENVRNYLDGAGQMFHDSVDTIVKRNFNSKVEYLGALSKVPIKHTPRIFRNMWSELGRHFKSEEVKVIFSLVSFFLGSTPFHTPAIYSLLNYTELQHDGYWNIKGGMYQIVQEMIKLLEEREVNVIYDTEIIGVEGNGNKVDFLTDQNGHKWNADVYVCNSDAAAFRGKILQRKKYSGRKLKNMDWTLAPFTIYLGVRGTIPKLYHHNYFLRNNFKEYAGNIFNTSMIPSKPYYYVNVSSRSNPDCAPKGCENLFILCPVPDLRYKTDWSDSSEIADNIITDLSERIEFDIKSHTLTQTVYTPEQWRDQFNLYMGSGLGLAHGMNQIAAFRPSNKDEIYNNLYYTGASTTPGTGLPMVVISSKLTSDRILKDYGTI